MKRVYPEPGAVANPTRDFSGELDELCRAKVAELRQAYLEAEVDELLGRERYARGDGRSAGYRDATIPNEPSSPQLGHSRFVVRACAERSTNPSYYRNTGAGCGQLIKRSISYGLRGSPTATSSRRCADSSG